MSAPPVPSLQDPGTCCPTACTTTNTVVEIPGPAGATGPSGTAAGVVAWHGAYDNAHAYAINDGVSYNGSSYVCIAASTGNLPTNVAFWQLLAAKGDTGATGAAGTPGGAVTWLGDWAVGTTYATNDAVSHNGSSYVSTADGNVGNDPESGSPWQLIAEAGADGTAASTANQSVNSAGTGYTVKTAEGDVVFSGGGAVSPTITVAVTGTYLILSGFRVTSTAKVNNSGYRLTVYIRNGATALHGTTVSTWSTLGYVSPNVTPAIYGYMPIALPPVVAVLTATNVLKLTALIDAGGTDKFVIDHGYITIFKLA